MDYEYAYNRTGESLVRKTGKLFSLLFLMVLGSQGRAAQDPCDWLLRVSPDFVKRFDVSRFHLNAPNTGERYARAAQALERVAKVTTAKRATKLAETLTDGPVVDAELRDAIDQSDFFLAHPERRSEAAANNFYALAHVLDRELSPFEVGLLAAIVGEVPRAARSLDQAQAEARASRTDEEEWTAYVRTALGRRTGLKLLLALRTQPRLTIGLVALTLTLTSINDVSLLDPAIVDAAIAEFRRGSVTVVGAAVVRAFGLMFASLVLDAERVEASSIHALTPAWWREAIDRNALGLASQIGDERLAPTLSRFLKMGVLRDPAPIAVEELERRITRGGRKLLASIGTATPSTHPPTIVAPRVSAEPSLLKDFYAPKQAPREKKKTSAQSTINVPDGAPRRVDPNGHSPSDRPKLTLYGRDLGPDQVYETNGSGRSETIYRVRFGPLVFRWMYRNATLSRRLVTQIEEGALANPERLKRFAHGRYDGQAYTIKPDKRFYAVILNVDGVWQVIDVVHNDHIERAIKAAVPL